MRAKLGLRVFNKMLCKAYEDLTILRSNGGEYDKKTMRWHGKGRTEHKAKIALFKQTGLAGNKTATFLEIDGKRVEYNVKFYTDFKIKHDDNNLEQSDIIVDSKGNHYIVVFLDDRLESKCEGAYIGYAKTYKGERIEK